MTAPARIEAEPYDTCPKCGWRVDYGCGCIDGNPTFPLITYSGATPARDKNKARERVLKAACDWVYDQSCSSALVELEDAVTDLVGTAIDPAKATTPGTDAVREVGRG